MKYSTRKKFVGVLLVTLSGLHSLATTSSHEVFEKVKDSLVIVQCDDASGSGFVLKKEDGKVYFVTNKHVVKGQKRVAAFLLSGKQLGLGQFYEAKGTDLVMFAITDKNINGLEVRDGEPNLRERIFVFGNSDGSGVATDLTGIINGVGHDRIEVTAKFVRGNSGSAVLDADGHVVGVATYVTRDADPKDWVKQGTRFSDVRRYALRLNGIEWIAKQYDSFYRACVAEIEKQKEAFGILPEASATFGCPSLHFLRNGGGAYRICSDISLSLRTTKKAVKNPIVRVCVLIKGGNGKYYMHDCIMSEAGSMRNARKCPPIYSYGNVSDGESYSLGNQYYVYYLEGISYYQSIFAGKSLCGIKYYDKIKDAGYGLFRVYSGEKPPNVVCFRLECWQNGSLAGVYNSATPIKLNGMHIPVDWFVRWKYPQLFVYE